MFVQSYSNSDAVVSDTIGLSEKKKYIIFGSFLCRNEFDVCYAQLNSYESTGVY